MVSKLFGGVLITVIVLFAAPIFAQSGCGGLPDHDTLKSALISAVAAESSGLNNQMWATIVNRDGVVCAVAFSGADRGAQWPGSRVISAQKANTANAFQTAYPDVVATGRSALSQACSAGRCSRYHARVACMTSPNAGSR